MMTRGVESSSEVGTVKRPTPTLWLLVLIGSCGEMDGMDSVGSRTGGRNHGAIWAMCR